MTVTEYRKAILDSAERIYKAEMDINRSNFAVCPLHDGDSSPSLKIYPDGKYFCFGCKSGGDVIQFIREKYSLSFKEALIFLDEGYNLHLNLSDEVEAEEEQLVRRTVEQQSLLNLSVGYFHKMLVGNPIVLEYALKRGLSLPHIEQRRIGWCPPDVTTLQNGISDFRGDGRLVTTVDLKEIGLITIAAGGKMTPVMGGRIIFPNISHTGEVMDLVGRRTDNSKEAKYKRLTPTNHMLGGSMLTKTHEYAILCEGIIDREVLEQLGYVAITAGGTGLKEDQAKTLTRVNTIYVCFDNEETGQGHKASIAVAKTLIGEGHKDVKIIQLPRDTETPKVDVASFYVEQCLEDRREFNRVFKDLMKGARNLAEYVIDSVSPDAPHNTLFKLLEDALPAIGAMDEFSQQYYAGIISKRFKAPNNLVLKALKPHKPKKTIEATESSLYMRDGCYYARTFDKYGNESETRVTNFTINVKSILVGPDGVTRVVELNNNAGGRSETFSFMGEDLANSLKFRSACLSRGNFLYEGEQWQLNEIVKIIFAQKAPFIQQPQTIGYHDGIWLYGNCGIDKTGQLIKADDDGIVWIGGKGYQAAKLYLTDDEDTSSLPNFNPSYLPFTDKELLSIAETLKQSLGGFEAYLALGWCIASINSHHMYREYGHFPYLFLAGKRQSGKSVLGSWLLKLFGFEIEDGKSIRTSTVVGINRRLSYFSSIPSWYDEYRGSDRAIQAKEGFLRGVFNRQSADKGIKASFGLRSERIRGTLMLSGEEVPNDNAMRSRCVNIYLSEYKRDTTVYKEMVHLTTRFGDLGLHLMRMSQSKNNVEALLNNIKGVTASLSDKGMDNRTATIYAMATGAFLTVFGYLLTEQEVDAFLQWTCDAVGAKVEELDTEHPVSQFWEDFLTMYSIGMINEKDYNLTRMELWLPNTIHDAWSEYCKRVNKPCINRQALLDYFKQEKYYVGGLPKWIPSKGTTTRCFGVNLMAPELVHLQVALNLVAVPQGLGAPEEKF